MTEDGISKIVIDTDEKYGNKARQIIIKLPVRHIEKPALALLTTKLRDDGIGYSKGNGNGIFENGEKIEIALPVTNKGPGPARNVSVVILESPNAIDIKPEEINLGNISPGQTLNAKFAMSLPVTWDRREIKLKWKVKEGRGLSEAEKEENLIFVQRTPEISFAYHYEDQGNRNGIIEKGEKVTLFITPKNTGNFPAESVRLLVELPEEGITLLNKEVDIGRLPPGSKGEEVSVTFRIKRIFKEGELPVALTFVQAHFPSEKRAIQLTVKEETAEVFVFGGEENQKEGKKPAGKIPSIQSPPVIVIAAPEDNQVITGENVFLEGRAVDDRQVSRLEIRVNNRLLPHTGRKKDLSLEQDSPKSSYAKKWNFREKILLQPGENIISITAIDDSGLQELKTIRVKRHTASREIYAAVIGINRYENPGISPLQFAYQDAASIRDHLIHNLGVQQKNLFELYNDDATRDNIRETLGIKLLNAGPEDTVIIYYSGHGAPEPDRRSPDGDGVEKYILPYDTDPGKLFISAISMDEISTIFRRLNAGWLVFIADSCYSGASGGRTVMANLKAPISDGFMQRLSEGKGRIIITASRANEVSIEGKEYGGGHGAFTYFFLKGLKGKADYNQDKKVDIEEIYSYVRKEVKEATNSRQTPIKKGESEGVIYLGKME